MSDRTAPMDPNLVDELSTRMLAIAQEVFRDDLAAMIVKGSAIKGDFIPYYSDFDIHIFADDSVMRGPLTPSQSISIPFQEQFSRIDVDRYRVSQIQVMIISANNHPPDWIPAMPGSYCLIYGKLPDSLPQVTEELIRTHALAGLGRYETWVNTLLERVVDKPDQQFADSVRLAGTLLKAALYEASIVLGYPPQETWNRSLRDVLDFVEPQVLSDRPASRYFDRAWHWMDIRTNGNELRPMFADALAALEKLGGLAIKVQR